MRRRRRWHEIPALRNLLGLHSPSRAAVGRCTCRLCPAVREHAPSPCSCDYLGGLCDRHLDEMREETP